MEDIFGFKFEELNEEDSNQRLSFCDLPLSICGSADFSTERQSFLSLSSSFSTEDTLFEFSSSELYDYPVEDILFCGKLISPKREITQEKSQMKSNSTNWVKKVYRKSISPKLDVSKIDAKKSNSVNCKKRVPGKLIFSGKEISKIDVKKLQSKSNSFDWEKKIQRRRSAAVSQQWPLLMFGPARVPPSKQSSVEKGSASERNLKREKRLWGVIKALGCGGRYLAVA